jgi:MFS family permease
MLSLLTSRHLRRFFFAHFQSQLGSGAAYVALVLIAYQRFRSGWAVALVLLADFLPGIVLSAPFGALADRWAIASFALTGLSNALIIGPELRLFQELVSERLLGRAFGLREMLSNIAFVLAFLAAGVLLSVLGVRSLFALGGTALVAMSLLGALVLHPHDRSATADAGPEPSGLPA